MPEIKLMNGEGHEREINNSGEEGKIANATIKNIMNMRKETSEIVRNRDN